MNAILLALILTGPFRPLASYDPGNTGPLIESLNDILSDKWLGLPASRPLACDGPCIELHAPAPAVACGDLRERVAKAQAGFREVRAAALTLGEALNQSGVGAPEAHARLVRAMATTRALLSESELTPTLVVQRSWRLVPSELLPGFPSTWPLQGAAFRVVRKTGRILADHPLDVRTTTEGGFTLVHANTRVAPVEYCAGDVSFRIEGQAVVQAGMPLTTSVALLADASANPAQVLTYPGDR